MTPKRVSYTRAEDLRNCRIARWILLVVEIALLSWILQRFGWLAWGITLAVSIVEGVKDSFDDWIGIIRGQKRCKCQIIYADEVSQ